jgi:UDP-hydrolysing UDP-N-acetyl-D-glucosamine 2-epimerase
MSKRKIAVVLVDRANYGRMKPVIKAIQTHPELELQLVCAGTMLLERYGNAVQLVEEDGFSVASRVYLELEGSIPLTMAKSIGIAIGEFATEFHRLQPDIVLLIGDCYEALAATIAASYLNICIAHIQGGEVSGSIDESARHAITKFANYHFPATKRSAEYVIRMGEKRETVFAVGCPCSDIIACSDLSINKETLNQKGLGAVIDPAQPYVVVVFHPVTSTYGSETRQVSQLYSALRDLHIQVIWLWPNIDAGADNISRYLRSRETDPDFKVRFIKTYPPEDYLRVMANSTCLIGNSSSFVRESSLLGIPVVLVGDRQYGREIDTNVKSVEPDQECIKEAVKWQLEQGFYQSSNLYGDGKAATRIAEALAEVKLYYQKTLAYVCEG